MRSSASKAKHISTALKGPFTRSPGRSEANVCTQAKENYIIAVTFSATAHSVDVARWSCSPRTKARFQILAPEIVASASDRA
jgi:hypothetical protein